MALLERASFSLSGQASTSRPSPVSASRHSRRLAQRLGRQEGWPGQADWFEQPGSSRGHTRTVCSSSGQGNSSTSSSSSANNGSNGNYSSNGGGGSGSQSSASGSFLASSFASVSSLSSWDGGELQPLMGSPSQASSKKVMVKPTRLSAPLITKKIKATTSWQALRDVVEEDGHNFNHIHVSAALLHLTHLLQASGALSSSSSSGSGSDASSDGEGRQYLRQRGLGQSRRRPGASSSSTSSQQGRGDSPGASASSSGELGGTLMAPLVPSPATRLIHPREAGDLLRKLLSMVQQQLENSDVQGISNTLYALAVLRQHDHALVEALLAAVQYRLDTARPQNLANIIWSCVTLSYTPDRDWMALYYDGVEGQVANFQAQDIANTLWAFGRLEFNGMQYKVAPDVVGRLLQAAFPRLREFTPQHLSNSLWGLARLGFAPSPTWAQAHAAASVAVMHSMRPAELASLVWAASRLQLSPGEAWLARAVQVSEPMLGSLEFYQLSQLVQGLGQLGAKPPGSWMTAMLHASMRQVHAYQAPAVVAMLSGVARMGLSDPALPQDLVRTWVATVLEAAWPMLDQQGPAAAAAAAAAGAASSNGSGARAAGRNGNGNGNGVHAAEDDEGGSDSEGNHSSSRGSPGPGRPGMVPHEWRFTSLEIALVLHALGEMGVRPKPAWTARALHALEHGPGMMQSLAADGGTVAMVLWALQRLVDPAPRVPEEAHRYGPLVTPELAAQEQQAQREELRRLQRLHQARGRSGAGGAEGASFAEEEGGHDDDGAYDDAGSQESHDQQLLARSGGGRGSAVGVAQEGQQGAPIPAGGGVPAEGGPLAAALPSFLSSILAATQPRVRSYGPMEIATIMQGLAHLGRCPEGDWMVRFWWRTLVLYGDKNMPPPGLTMTVAALARLGQRPHRTWWKGALRAARMGFPRFEAHHFSNLLRGMAELRFRPGEQWLRSYLLATYRVWGELTPGHWADLLHGLGRLQLTPPPEWLDRWFATSARQLRAYEGPQLARVAWALGTLKVRAPGPWASAFFAASRPKLKSLSPGQLLRVVWAANYVVRVPDAKWIVAATAAARAHAGGGYRPEQEQLMAMALQRLKLRAQAQGVLSREGAGGSSGNGSSGNGSSGGAGEEDAHDVGSGGDNGHSVRTQHAAQQQEQQQGRQQAAAGEAGEVSSWLQEVAGEVGASPVVQVDSSAVAPASQPVPASATTGRGRGAGRGKSAGSQQ